MVEFTGITQTVKPGGVVTFNEATVIGSSPVIHREGSGVFTLPSRGCSCIGTGYKITFGGNITFPATAPEGETAATAPISLAIAIEGQPDVTTAMVATPAAAGDLVNVNRSAVVKTLAGCCASVAVENTSNGTITVENPNLIIDEEGGVVYAY